MLVELVNVGQHELLEAAKAVYHDDPLSATDSKSQRISLLWDGPLKTAFERHLSTTNYFESCLANQ